MKGKNKKQVSWSTLVSQRITALQRTTEKQMRAGWERGMDLLPPALRKTTKQLTTDLERRRQDARKRGARLVSDIRKAASSLTAQAEKRVASVLSPVTRRFDVATRAEVEKLRKRLDQVERRLHTQSSQSSAAA